MKHYHAFVIALSAGLLACHGLTSCGQPGLSIATPAVRAQVVGALEKDLLAAGGALILSGGSTGAAVAAVSAQELKNLPELQRVLSTASQPAEGKSPAATAVTP